ncbi:hypothetical protein MVEN_01945500 [Mycena venus]|uniref:PHD-type domain-containing protein n=1 Tax=Mycena venus TaxID=2733690 RepID=A0A8H6XGS4_9AGAR|nr:hypothetical protein MVEN_01945500 [Mycena venus]
MSAQIPRADQGPDLFSQTAHHPVPNSATETQRSLSSPSDSGMSPFPQGRTHLPTPQSPDYMGQYLNLQAPESPLAQASYMAYATMGRPVYGLPLQKPCVNTDRGIQPSCLCDTSFQSSILRQFCDTPGGFLFYNPSIASHSEQTFIANDHPTPLGPESCRLVVAVFGQAHDDGQDPPTFPRVRGTDFVPNTLRPLPGKSSLALRLLLYKFPHLPLPPTPGSASSVPLAAPTPVAGGEMERIRQVMMQNHLAQHQEAEAHALLSASWTALIRGRRITLFQETSDESFEESLMAGGYGRYRTADWVRQPQPMAPTPVPPGPSTVLKRSEEPTPLRPPTEKELRKRKRLEAFRSNETTNTSGDPHTSKLFPVNLVTMGRVLVDNVGEENGFASTAADSSPSKNGMGGTGKRAMAAANKKAKKKTQEPSAREKKMAIAAQALEDANEKPNWPDAEFPWRLRSEERAEITKEEEEHRMQLIENFLNRDTDDEDGSEEEDGGKNGEDEDLLDPSEWDKVYEDGKQRPIPSRGGRGKMVQLSAEPHVDRPVGGIKRSRFFPTDPGDARAALLAKKSVRSLSFRQQRRERAKGADTDEVLCICRGKYDEDGDVVQCDLCGIWYHLHCIGIHNIADLGQEDDPWYCEKCYVVERSESSEEEETRAPEPTFVPTDNEPPRVSHSSDTPLYQPVALQESPMPWSGPKTPPRGSTARDFGSAFSSIASGSRAPFTPSTPHSSNRRRSSVQTFGHDTPGGGFDVDDLPFDPTSTPSRGIKFGAPFATPKNMWPVKPNGLFETPSRRRDSTSRLFGAPGTLDESASGGGVLFSSPFGRMPTYDDSPIRRDTAPAGDAQRTRRLLESPIAPSVGGGRYLGHMMTTLEDSPVMVLSTKRKERVHEAP